MFDLKISADEIRNLLPSEDPLVVEEIFCFIAWSVICEPGDGMAGLVVGALGSRRALANELHSVSVQDIRSQLLDSGMGDIEINKHGNFEKAYLTARERWRPRTSLDLVRQAICRIREVNGFVLTPAHGSWPASLEDLDSHSPMALWVRGSTQAIIRLQKSVAVVGCRGSSAYGELATQSMVSAVVEKGFSVVSGGAYGIDGVAHRATLALQGNTVAVMAGGVDKFYPSGNSDLLRRVSETGAVVSELPPGSMPTKWRFLHRKGRL